MRQPCIDCGQPSDRTRCPTHERQHRTATNASQQRRRNANGPRPYEQPGYRAAAATIRATATRCWICGEGPRPHDPWQADHVTPIADGGADGPLAPAHRSCNIGRANRARAHQPKRHR